MLHPSQLHGYQQRAVNFQCTHPETALWLDPGLGKTATTLTSIVHLLNTQFLRAVLIVAPIRVCRLVWKQEAAKWEHTKHLKFSMLLGTRDQRTRALMRPDTQVFLVNYENLGWLAEVLHTYYISKGKPIPFDGLVWDEISKCFTAGTMISCGNLQVPIENLVVGDIVDTHLGPRAITSVMRNKSDRLVSIHLTNGTKVTCTHDHPFLTNGVWVKAHQLNEGDPLYERTFDTSIWSRNLCDLPSSFLEATGDSEHMLQTMFRVSENAKPRTSREVLNQWHESTVRAQEAQRSVEQRDTLVRGSKIENERVPQETRSFTPEWRKWDRTVTCGSTSEKSVAGQFCNAVHPSSDEKDSGYSNSLQNRFCRPESEDRNRGAGSESQHRIGSPTGCEEEKLSGVVRVASVVYHEQGSQTDVWNIEVADAQTYYANGVLVHNCKNSTTQRVKSVRKILPHFKWRTGLTGTPASNGYKDLHGQFLVLDEGKRLGTSKTAFRTRFYKKVGPFKEVAYDDTETVIKNLIGDMTIEMSAADYLKMPDLIVNDVTVEMDDVTRAAYEKMEKEFFIKLDSGAEKEMFNQASLMNACLQYSNGAIYPVAGMPLWEPIHDLKLDALEDILEEAGGKPVLCWYAYRSDAQRIMDRFKEYDPINLTECKSDLALNNAMHRWQNGQCRLMISHPLSAGHGVDGLQKSGSTMVWFGLTWSLDSYDQAVARLHRQGQGAPVICHRIMTKDTLDQAQAEALDAKAQDQNALRLAVKNYRANKLKSS